MVVPSIAADPRLKWLGKRLHEKRGVHHVSGLWGSSAPMLAALLAARSDRAFLYVTAHVDQADQAMDDLELFLGRSCEIFPAWESLPYQGASNLEIEAERLRICLRHRSPFSFGETTFGTDSGIQPSNATQKRKRNHNVRGRQERQPSVGGKAPPPLVVAPILALLQPVPKPELLNQHALRISVGGGGGSSDLSPDGLLRWAIDHGFERLDLVESPGDVARRGELIDLFVPGESSPFRIQFDEDTIESIRRFDVSTQHSLESLASITVCVLPPDTTFTSVNGTHLLHYFPQNAVIVLEHPTEIQELGETLLSRMGRPDSLFSVEHILQECTRRTCLFLSHFGSAAAAGEDAVDMGVASLNRFEGQTETAIAELFELAREKEVYVFCDNEGERQRLDEILAENAVPPSNNIHTEIGVLHHGFLWTATGTAVIAHHEIFHRRRPRRRVRRIDAGRPLESWTDLKAGDYVVHVLHGIAVYRGLYRMQKGDAGQREEFLTLEFAEGGVVHVPCSQIDLVQKYIGAGGRKPNLSTLGGKRWKRTKEKVAEAVSDLAESLLRLQAIRSEIQGTAYPPDTAWQREFETAFLYEETQDQLLVAREIREDLCRPRPMDRLVCGDVGYGKTELAMRAAFKVIEYGRQVAVLVPTTVLAEQHYDTFRQRMADYPFSIGCLSRFRSPSEQKTIVDKARRGQIDVVVGTHRLLSSDVRFANLGLVIIDEEQRFGVEHKEKLRTMRETVDVLTLSATPIPRTLHMSLVGIRDISSLQTPPVDRRAISTQVRPFDKALIRDAILREINRDGQVYFIHNYVQSIAEMAETIRDIVPEARVVYGHGQMADEQLEKRMHAFVRREADVLVATTIIESGIDIPTVNTILINRADRFGLADLHQLRGRVGRSNQRAYCYLLLSPDRPPTSKAAKRLKTIEEFSELGAGFRIAMRDLEIRGAGNLLGKEQSGHIAAVGYEMYCRLVEQAVRRLKKEPDVRPPLVHVDLDVSAHIPTHYAPSDRTRIEIYRRIVSCGTCEDLKRLEEELADVFGPIPMEVQRLLEIAEIRVRARAFGIESISLQPPDVVFEIQKLPLAEPLFRRTPGSVRIPDPKTVHLRLPPAYLEPKTLVSVLRRMLVQAGDSAPTPV